MQQTTADPTEMPQIAAPQLPRTRRFRTARVVMALILREIGSSDSRSSLGFLWTIIDPIAQIIVLSFAFSFISRSPRLGDNFQLYYVTGVIPFHMYTQISSKVASSIRFSRQLLGFPSVTVLDALFARFLLNMFIDCLVFIVLTYYVIHFYDLRVDIDIETAFLSIAMAGALAVGVGTFNSVLFLLMPAYENIFSVISRPLMIASGVLLLIDDLPVRVASVLWWNPAAHVVGMMRHAFFPTFNPSHLSASYVFLVAGIAFVLGLVSLQRFVYDALDR
ncbi:MAG: ABC transporter permease [bacterium]